MHPLARTTRQIPDRQSRRRRDAHPPRNVGTITLCHRLDASRKPRSLRRRSLVRLEAAIQRSPKIRQPALRGDPGEPLAAEEPRTRTPRRGVHGGLSVQALAWAPGCDQTIHHERKYRGRRGQHLRKRSAAPSGDSSNASGGKNREASIRTVGRRCPSGPQGCDSGRRHNAT